MVDRCTCQLGFAYGEAVSSRVLTHPEDVKLGSWITLSSQLGVLRGWRSCGGGRPSVTLDGVAVGRETFWQVLLHEPHPLAEHGMA